MKKILFILSLALLIPLIGFAQIYPTSTLPVKQGETTVLDRDTWLTWANDPIAAVVGANGIPFGIYHRYTPADLTSYVGQSITKIKYQPYNHPDGPTTFSTNPKLQVYVGGSVIGGVYNPGTLVVDHTVATYTFNTDQTIELPTSVLITGTEEVWIGIFYTTTGTTGYPGCSTASSGTGSYIEGKSNIFYIGGSYNEWGPSSEMFNPPNNKHCWTHAAFVELINVGGDCDPATNLNAAYNEGCNAAVLTWDAPAKGKVLQTPIQQEKIERQKANTPNDFTRISASTQEEIIEGEPFRGPTSDLYYGLEQQTQWYKGTLSNFNGTLLGPSGRNIQASEYINGTLYGVSYSSGNQFGTINQTTGAFTIIKAGFDFDAVSMCYNPTNGLTYCFPWGGGSFGTVNLANGECTNVGTIQPTGNTGTLFAAIDNDGVCYAVRNTTGQFGTVNLATGAFTLIATFPGITTSGVQEMTIDRETNEIYWAKSGTPYNVYKINKTTGAITQVGIMAGQAYVFSAATLPPEPCDAVSNLNLTTSGSSVTLTWTAAPGSPTGYKIDYDGGDLTTITTTSYTHNSVPDGLHTYTVTALYPGSCIPFGVTKTIIVGDMCMFKIVMQGDANDSWNDGMGGSCSIDVISGSTTYGTATMPYDSYDATSFIVVPSGELKFSWITTGGYPNECQFQIYNSAGTVIHSSSPSSGHGGSGMTGVSGVFFTYENDCEGGTQPGDNLYNIYRGTTLIQSNYASTTYTDADVNSSVANTWSVKVACEEGGESAAVSKTLDPCEIPGDCYPATNLNVTYTADCKAELTWNAPGKSVISSRISINLDEKPSTMQRSANTSKGITNEFNNVSNNSCVLSNATQSGYNASKGTFFDGAEDHPDFAVNSTVNGWSYIDVDGSDVWGMEDQNHNEIYWPNSGDPQAFIVFNPSNTEPSLGDDQALAPHTGNKFFACFAAILPGDGGTGPNNDWMISPLLENPTHLSFWAKSYTANYGLDRFKVAYSITGTAISNFTFLTTSYVSAPATAWTLYEYTLPVGTKYIAINCVSNDSFILMIDDITITTSGDDPNKYNIYRDGVLVKADHTSTSYTDSGFDISQGHEWSVKVVCEEGGLSAPVTKAIDTPCTPSGECLPATLNDITIASNCNQLTWNMPAKRGEVTITQSYGPGTGVIGSTGSLSFGVYNRFRPEDLVAVNGGELTKFVFVPGMGDTQGGEPRHNYTIRIYQGGSWSATPGERTPGTLIFSQPLNNDELDFDSGNDNIIMLTEPIIIDASQELWIGYWCQATSPGGYPALTDVGPRKSGLGDVMNYQGWTTLYDVLSSSPYNWYMQGKVQITPPTFNIYRDGVKIVNAFEGTTYLDCTFTPAPSICYQVEVICPDGSVSDLSEQKCTDHWTVKENGKTSFSIVPNPTRHNITVTADNSFHTIEVVSFLGQVVISQPNDREYASIDVSNLSNGVYFVRIISENGTNVQKFVKQ